MFLIFFLVRCINASIRSYKVLNIKMIGAITITPKITKPVMMNGFIIGNTSKSFDISLYLIFYFGDNQMSIPNFIFFMVESS
jgi:hypothetical protein